MEDFKKKYEEAVQRAMDYASGKYPEALVSTKAAVELIFPELKGSDDEKIRKDLIQWIDDFPDAIWRGHYKKDVIAWLEMQCEQKPAEWSEEDEYCRHQLILFCENCMVQDGNAKKCANWLKSLKDRVQPQPKQEKEILESEMKKPVEWSEEDEKVFGIALDIVAWYYDVHEDKAKTVSKWLKSIKDRVQPKQEWSEEDEYCRYKLIMFCENCVVQDDDAKKCANWLKSLKPQSHWKPSEEQLDALHDAAVYVDKSMFPHPKGILMKMYEQLKKLREEQP